MFPLGFFFHKVSIDENGQILGAEQELQEREEAENGKKKTNRATFRTIIVKKQKLPVLRGEGGNTDPVSSDTDNYI